MWLMNPETLQCVLHIYEMAVQVWKKSPFLRARVYSGSQCSISTIHLRILEEKVELYMIK